MVKFLTRVLIPFFLFVSDIFLFVLFGRNIITIRTDLKDKHRRVGEVDISKNPAHHRGAEAESEVG